MKQLPYIFELAYNRLRTIPGDNWHDWVTPSTALQNALENLL